MVGFVEACNPWERIAVSIERLAEALKPKAAPLPIVTPPDAVCTPAQAAEILQLNEQTIREYCRKRVFGTRLSNGRWIIRQSELEQYLSGQRLVHGKVST